MEIEEFCVELVELCVRVVVVLDGYVFVLVELMWEMFIVINKEDDKVYVGGCYYGVQFEWLWQVVFDVVLCFNGKVVSEGFLWKILSGEECLKEVEELRVLFGEGKEDD